MLAVGGGCGITSNSPSPALVLGAQENRDLPPGRASARAHGPAAAKTKVLPRVDNDRMHELIGQSVSATQTTEAAGAVIPSPSRVELKTPGYNVCTETWKRACSKREREYRAFTTLAVTPLAKVQPDLKYRKCHV